MWLDPAGAKCIDECGAKEVSVRTTGHDKMRVTVMLLARADGYKCKPYVLLPRKRPDPRVVEKFKSKLFLAWAGKVWMDDELTSDFLQRVLGSTLFGKRLLVWDAFRCHISESTKKRLRELKIHTAVVPGGCTKFVQVSRRRVGGGAFASSTNFLSSACRRLVERPVQGEDQALARRVDVYRRPDGVDCERQPQSAINGRLSRLDRAGVGIDL